AGAASRGCLASFPTRRSSDLSHAPGLAGTPWSGHCRRAATVASPARSSASATSLVIRASVAITEAPSIRHTAARRSAISSGMLLSRCRALFLRACSTALLLLDAPALLLLDVLVISVIGEVAPFVDATYFHLAALAQRGPARPFDGLGLGGYLQDPEPV